MPHNEILYSAPAKEGGKTCTATLRCKRAAPGTTLAVQSEETPVWTQRDRHGDSEGSHDPRLFHLRLSASHDLRQWPSLPQ